MAEAECEAVEILTVDESNASSGRTHAIVKCTHPSGGQFALAIPTPQLQSLVDLAAAQHSHNTGYQKAEYGEVNPFESSHIEVAGTPNETVIMSITFGAGGTLHFHLAQPQIELLFYKLGVAMGLPIPQTMRTSIN